ncbi:MAG: hypothetical protein RIE58_07940 [Vicingaceae bacterium]
MDLSAMRLNITQLIDDVKYQSDMLTDIERLPVIQLKVILAKINKLHEETAVLLHYVEQQSIENQKVTRVEEQLESTEKETTISDIPAQEPSLESNTPSKAKVTPAEPAKGKSSEYLEDKLKRLVVKDLNTAIGINEKYLFASELFAGSIEMLKESVSVLNQLVDLDQANAYLDEMASKHNWDPESEIVKNFRELVEKKYDQP